MIVEAIEPFQAHPMTAPAWAQRMGLALEEPPYTDVGETFEEDEVYSLRIGITDGARQAMICGGMIRVGSDGAEGFNPDGS